MHFQEPEVVATRRRSRPVRKRSPASSDMLEIGLVIEIQPAEDKALHKQRLAIKQRLPDTRTEASDAVKRYIAEKIRCDDVDMFDALCAKQMGKVYVAVRKACRDRDRDREARMTTRLKNEEAARKQLETRTMAQMTSADRDWHKRKRKAERDRHMQELGRFVERTLGVDKHNFVISKSCTYIGQVTATAVTRRAESIYADRKARPRKNR